MLVLVVCLVAVAAAAPALDYDQSQEGERNVRVDIHNVAVILAKPANRPNYNNILEFLSGLKRKSNYVVPVSYDTDLDSTKDESEPMEYITIEENIENDPQNGVFVVEDGKLVPYLMSNSTKITKDCGPGKYRDKQGVCRSSVLPRTHKPAESLGSSNVTVNSGGEKPHPDKGDKSYESFYGQLIKKWATSTTTTNPVSKNYTSSS